MTERTDAEKNRRDNHIYYKCSACGVMHDGADGAPKTCVKCDNDKFYKVIKK